MNILITGGSGMIGHAVIEELSKYSEYTLHYPTHKECDLNNYQSTKNLFDNIQPDYVIHLAAIVGGLFRNMNEMTKMFEQNTNINLNVLKCANESPTVKKCFSMLSTCIFPNNEDNHLGEILNENSLHLGPPHNSNYGYAYAKRLIEIQSRIYNESSQTNSNKFICLCPTNVYGEYDNFNLETSHVIPALIKKCYDAKRSKTKFLINGTGAPLRQYIYSKDIAKIISHLINISNDNNTNNIPPIVILSPPANKEISIKDVVDIICDIFNYHNIEYDNIEYNNGQFKKTVSNNVLQSIYPYNLTLLKDGLKNVIEWYIKNY